MEQNNAKVEERGVVHSENAVRHSRRGDIIAAVVCLLLAFLVWMVVMNVEDTADVALTPVGGDTSAYTYTLSEDSLAVRGRIVSLKKAKNEGVRVEVPDGLTEGNYEISRVKLITPDGVVIVEGPDLILTVTKK